MVRYYGYYSNVKRGRRKNKNQDEWMPFVLESEGSTKEYRKNWAKLIQKIYEVDPLTCPKCVNIRLSRRVFNSSIRVSQKSLAPKTTKSC